MKKRSGVSFIGILIALAIIGLLYYFYTKAYLNNPADADKESQEALIEQGINTKNLPGAVENAENAAQKADQLNKQLEKNLQEQK